MKDTLLLTQTTTIRRVEVLMALTKVMVKDTMTMATTTLTMTTTEKSIKVIARDSTTTLTIIRRSMTKRTLFLTPIININIATMMKWQESFQPERSSKILKRFLLSQVISMVVARERMLVELTKISNSQLTRRKVS